LNPPSHNINSSIISSKIPQICFC